jgi:prepilin-type N-terminal cleavage/methylation domain-containing protein
MRAGFTLVELMIVVAIIIILTMLAVPNFTTFVAKAKRAEAYANLHAIYAAEKTFWIEHGTYTSVLFGTHSAGWQPEGYRGGGAQENFYYTYGFAGTEGTNHYTGKLNTPASFLHGSHADVNGFVAVAAGYINGQKKPDIITIDHNNRITVVQDALS